MQIGRFFRELKDRRVIRATLIYVALLWAALQAADLFAGAGIIGVGTVRWLILIGALGLPVVVLASWFYEAPWRERRWTNIAGDVVVILAIGIAAALFAWQQWFSSFSRPTLSVLVIEATDTSEDSVRIADHLARRFRMLLATRPELRVTANESSFHDSLASMTLQQRARSLGSDMLLTGTLNRADGAMRLSLQLFSRSGELIWNDRFEDRLVDQAQLQTEVLAALADELPVGADTFDATREIVTHCDYPADEASILALARAPDGDASELAPYIAQNDEAGLLYIEQSKAYFRQRDKAAMTRRPVLQQLAMQSLVMAEDACPRHPYVEKLQLINTGAIQQDGAALLARLPNDAALYLAVAGELSVAGDHKGTRALVNEALALDPLGARTRCRADNLLESREQQACP